MFENWNEFEIGDIAVADVGSVRKDQSHGCEIAPI